MPELNEGFSGFGKSWPRLTSESGKNFGNRTDFVSGLMFSGVRFCSGYGGWFFPCFRGDPGVGIQGVLVVERFESFNFLP